MNPHQFQNYPNSLSEAQKFYLLSTPPSSYPLILNNQYQSLQTLHLPTPNPFSPPKPPYHSISSAFKCPGEPTKRVKLSEQDYIQNPINFQEGSVLSQNSKEKQRTKNSQDLQQNPGDFEALYLLKQRLMDMEQNGETDEGSMKIFGQQIQANINFGNDLIIPTLNKFKSELNGAIFPTSALNQHQDQEQRYYETPRLSVYHQRMLEQLEQQRAEKIHQQQILQILEKQQQRFEAIFRSQWTQDARSQELQRLLMLQEAQKREVISQNAPFLFDPNPALKLNYSEEHYKMNLVSGFGKDESLKLNSAQYPVVYLDFMTDANNSEESNNEKTVEIPELKIEEGHYYETLGDAKRPRQKNKKSDSGDTDSKKTRSRKHSYDYPENFGYFLKEKTREGPRRKNKWQCMIDDQDPNSAQYPQESVLEGAEPVNIEVVENPQNVQEIQPVNPTELPQYMFDDSLIDYNHLMFMRITNDPACLGKDDLDMKFVMTNADPKEDADNEQVKTKVGESYQAKIPNLGEVSSREKVRHYEAAWNPGMVRETLLKTYFEDLCRILGCNISMINQERALKLLKRKKFKKEKVKVNISKNEKFYSKYLLVNRLGSETLLNNDIT